MNAGKNGDDRSRPNTAESDAFERCAQCRAPLPQETWCPTATERDQDGELAVYTFCDETCKAAWEDTRDTRDR